MKKLFATSFILVINQFIKYNINVRKLNVFLNRKQIYYMIKRNKLIYFF